MPIRVAFCGPAGAGKTTHARLMQKETGGDVLSFASPLKKLVQDLFGELPPEQQRSAYQEFGVLARRFDTEVWVNKLVSKVSPDRPCYVDDCRFPNEANALRKLGFVIVKVDALTETLLGRRPGMTYSQRLHESEVESAMIHQDILVMNDGDLDQIHADVLHALQFERPEWKLKRK